MDKTKHTLKHYTSTYPMTGFQTADEISESLDNLISAERLLSLAEAGYCPHYRIDGGKPLFKKSEIKSWVKKSLTYHEKGKELPIKLQVYVKKKPACFEKPPGAIKEIKELIAIETWRYPPGIYFLCNADEVLYVGQSVKVLQRVTIHCEDKHFDRVYLLPVPREDLDAVESLFIRMLEPELNGRMKNGKIVAPAKRNWPPDDVILKKYGIELARRRTVDAA